MAYRDMGGEQPNPGMYWFHDDQETCVTYEGVSLDAWGLYPWRSDALLLPSIEAGEAAACDCEPAWGAWNMQDPRSPVQFRDLMLEAQNLSSPGDSIATPSGREAVDYFDVFRCLRERVDLQAAPVTRAFELGRIEVPSGAVGVFEHVETALKVELVDPNATFSPGSVNGIDWRHTPYNMGAVGPNGEFARIVDNDPCPWPALVSFNTPGNPTAVNVSCEWVWVAQGVPSDGGDRPPEIQNVPPALVIPPGVSIGPGRWRDQRWAHGLPRPGVAQWLLRGPYLARLFAVVTLQASDDVALFVRPLGRMSGFLQQYGAREASLASAIVRRP